MDSEPPDEGPVFLSIVPAERSEIRLARVVVSLSVVAFLVAAPFAKTLLPEVPAFLPIYQSALIINELITAVLLFGQYSILRSRALSVLASGYLFSAAMAVAHALSFPGLFTPTGLLDAGPQTTAWLYFMWHAGFPLFVVGYTLLKDEEHGQPSPGTRISAVVLRYVVAVFVLVGGLSLLATIGEGLLPVIMSGNMDAPAKLIVATGVWMLSLIALAILWRRRPHSVLDLWLMVVLCAWIFDSALAAVLNHSRYDLGWYAGRIYGLLAASFVLMALLTENAKLYFRLAKAHESERKKTVDLERLNGQIKDRVEERSIALEALHAKEAELRAILENLYDCVITIDSQGIVRSANPAAERILGYAASDLIGKNVSMIIPEPHRSARDAYLDNCQRTGVACVIGSGREVEGLHRNGKRIALELAVTEYRVGEQCFFIGTLRDIRERKRFIEELTQARADAEQANRAKDSFLATMSHEIRTPLTGMLGMLELLSMTRLDDEQAATLDAAWGSTRGLLRIVNDILDWSKIVEGKLQLAPQAISLQQLLQEVVNTYSRVASAKNLVLWQHADARLSAAHSVDSLRLSQVLNNFVSNAIKFTQHGEIEIRAELLDRFDSGERIRFSVKDTGIGIAREVQEHLFQRYRQGQADTARMYGGTGLGLAICRRLAELMDGQVELASEPGQGATFSIVLTLPVSAQAESMLLNAHPEVEQRTVMPLFDGGGNAPMVLAVDDHPINRNLLARQLALLGLRVATAEDGQMALSMWREGGFAAVITDCHMPEMDGYALTRAIRKIEAAEARPHIPVIAWTANAHPEECAKCQSAGMDELLVKPNNLAQLKRTLTLCLSLPEAEDSQPAASAADAGVDERSRPIDYAALTQVVPDSATHVRVLLDFQRYLRADCAKVLGLLEQGDLDNVVITAHRMKGSSRMVGAVFLAKACAALERAAADGDPAGARAARTALDEAAGNLDAYLDELAKSVDQR